MGYVERIIFGYLIALAVYGLVVMIEARVFQKFLDEVDVFIWKIARLISVIVFIGGLLYLSLFRNGQLSNFLEAILFLFLLVFIFYLGSYPAEAANWLYRTLRQFNPYQKISGFWNLHDLNRHFRKLIIGLLFGFTFLITAIDFYLFSSLSLARQSGIWLLGAGIFFAGFIAVVFILDYLRYRQMLPEVEHQRMGELQALVQNLAITAGIASPRLRIINLKTPTAFTIVDNVAAGSHTINISSGMINLLEKPELEAVLAHELSHMRSGQPLDYYKLATLLSLLKAVGGGFVVLVIAGVFPPLVYLWMFILIMLALESHNNDSPYIINNNSVVYALFIFLMPAYSLINFFGCLIYYFLSANEDYYADLSAILLTRYPAGLYRVLDRLEQNKENFPGEFFTKLNILYFVGENIYSLIPQPQPPLLRRKQLISRVDETLKGLTTIPRDQVLACPACHRPMDRLRADSHYIKNNIELDKCPNCRGVWFDGYELYYIADLTLIGIDSNIGNANTEDFQDKIKCPHCGVLMDDQHSYNIPTNINIWTCPTCNGSFMSNDDVYHYGMLRKQDKTIRNLN
jgi:Zn-dependent protease with chaperone function/Zn-finger nucleic acid-binding protein